jgi:16S rRNA (adenine1518-N6/adenine1519-N6)-dimethyltransferase
VVRIEVDDGAWPQVGDRDEFFRLVRAGFAQRRKYLRNSLAHGLGMASKEAAHILAAAGLPEKVRAQNLSVEDWASLYFRWQELPANPQKEE